MTHSGDRKMVSSEEVAGAERARAQSLSRELEDALVPGTAELTSILTCPKLTGVAPTNEKCNLKTDFFFLQFINHEKIHRYSVE